MQSAPSLPLRFGWTRRATARWHRPSLWLVLLLAGTAALYGWNDAISGNANSFYSAAVLAGTRSWKAFFFGSFDASNFITVDKPPASLWVMELSGRLFGFNAWSMLLPEALEGVASVLLLYLTVKRSFGQVAGLIAGVVFAATPVAALIFRFNNPDALLLTLLVAAIAATARGLEQGRTRWFVLAGCLVGFGFLTKTLQAFLVLPALAGVLLVAAPGGYRRRLLQLVAAATAVVLSGGWWVAIVSLWPASDRPYIGGSADNSELNLIVGYNGFGRITGNETGSVGGSGVAGSMWGATGWSRLLTGDWGSDIAWLLPAAVALLVVVLVARGSSPRGDARRAAALLWGGSLLVTVITFSYAQGIIHPYYSVALVPGVAALVGMGAVTLWEHRDRWAARLVASALMLGTAIWTVVLLGRSPSWMPWLTPVVLVLAVAAAAGWLIGHRLPIRWTAVVAVVAVVAVLGAPVSYSIDTALTAHTGSLPTAGPAVNDASSAGGPGGGAGGPGAGGNAAAGPGGPQRGTSGAGFPPGAGPGGGLPSGARAPDRGAGGAGPGGFGGVGGTAPSGVGVTGPGGGGGGGLLNASTPSAALTRMLESGASHYTWIAAAVGSQTAAGYELATGDPVMSIGGFNGTDPAPTLAQFEALVAKGDIHYFISGSGGAGPSAGTGSATASAITAWVEKTYTATSVGGVEVYNLTPSVSKAA